MSIEIPTTRRAWVLAAHPKGAPVESDLRLEEQPFDSELTDGQFIVKVNVMSVDPFLRGIMTGYAYGNKFEVGTVMPSYGAGVVAKSENSDFPVGTVVSGFFQWSEWIKVTDGARVKKYNADWKLSHSVGVLGMPGATAYLGLREICDPQEGETVFVTGAAGAVGSAVGQIAKALGCTVIGTAGSDEKCEWLKSIGFDFALNYRGKDTDTLAAELKEVAPKGINCFFDNTGGSSSEAAMINLASQARVSVCGSISNYNNGLERVNEVPMLFLALRKRCTIRGFIVSADWGQDKWAEAHTQLHSWIEEGKFVVRETTYEGLENAQKAFYGLFSGDNIGKAIINL